MDNCTIIESESLFFNTGYIRDRSYDFIIRTAQELLDIFRRCGKYCDKFEIEKITDVDGRIFYVLSWE